MTKISIILTVLLWLFTSKVESQVLVDAVDEIFTGVKSINVKGLFCSVEFEEGVSSAVKFESEIRAIKPYESLRIRHEQKGSQLNVWVDMKGTITGQTKGVLHFIVPRDIVVIVENSSGNVSISEIGRETLKVSTESGNIIIENISCDVELFTSSGNINCKKITGNLKTKSMSGNTNAVDIKGSADITTTSGLINAQKILKNVNILSSSGSVIIASVYSDITVNSTSGNIELNDVKGKVKLRSSSGNIRVVDFVGELDAGTASGSINGYSVMITGNSVFNSSMGNIDIGFLNAPKSLSYELNSSFGTIEAEGTTGDKKLTINEGPVKIVGTTTSGNQRYKKQ